MMELLITVVWLASLTSIVVFIVGEIVRLVSLDDAPGRRPRGLATAPEPMYFDVTKIDRSVTSRERAGRRAAG